MAKAILFIPSEEAIDRSLDARSYVNRLSKRLELEKRSYDASEQVQGVEENVESVAVLSALSALELESGYMEMELDTIFRPQELLGNLRRALGREFPIVAIVDDAYSDYIMSAYVKAGATAVVGTSGDLFGVVLSRMKSWDQLFPYINAFVRL